MLVVQTPLWLNKLESIMKQGDEVRFTQSGHQGYINESNLAQVTYDLLAGKTTKVKCIEGNKVYTPNGIWFYFSDLEVVPKDKTYTKEQFASAFNAWQDAYILNPQGYKDSYETAMRHVSEKLKGEEASYGAVAAEVFQSYLDKLESK